MMEIVSDGFILFFDLSIRRCRFRVFVSAAKISWLINIPINLIYLVIIGSIQRIERVSMYSRLGFMVDKLIRYPHINGQNSDLNDRFI